MLSRFTKLFLAVCAAGLLSGPGAVTANAQESNPSQAAAAPQAQTSEVLRTIRQLSLHITELSNKLSRMEQEARALIDMELLTRAEQRGEDLRAELLRLQMKEMDLQARLEELDYRLRPQSIQQALSLVGSTRMDELRGDLRIRLENEKGRVNRQLDLIASNRERIEATLKDAEELVDRLRQRLGSW